MAHNSTVITQILKLVPRHEFEQLAKKHHTGRSFRKMSRWKQFVALALGQLGGRQSLRDIISNLHAQSHKLYHLGAGLVTKTTLARVNEDKPHTLYEELFSKLYSHCQGLAPKHGFRFKNKLYSLDASLIDLSLKIFPWAEYNREKAAMKLHVGLDHDGYLPSFVAVTESKRSDIDGGRQFSLPKGSIVIFDKGYASYEWFQTLHKKGVFFVTRLRSDALYKVKARRKVDKKNGLVSDHTIELTSNRAKKANIGLMRKVTYIDPETKKRYEFLTNVFHLSAATITEIYKQRWQVELFFKWIKQNLKIKSFLGVSKNAVLTQIWVALCVYLLIAFIKFSNNIRQSMQQILRLLQLNLFDRRDMLSLVRGESPGRSEAVDDFQICLKLS